MKTSSTPTIGAPSKSARHRPHGRLKPPCRAGSKGVTLAGCLLFTLLSTGWTQQNTGRPSFLPAAPPPTPQVNDSPQTIVTQIELPTPPPTAEPLEIEGAYRNAASDADFVRQPSPAPISFGTPETTLPSHAPTAAASTPSPSPVTTTTQSEPPAYDPLTPTIIYDEGQAAVPRKPVVEIPVGPDPGVLLRQGRYSEVEPFAEENRDSHLAASLGWAYYRSKKNQSAYTWFEKAVQWDDTNYEAAYGLALTLFRLGRESQAEEVARWRLAQYPKMRSILADIETRRAVSSFQSKNYRTSLQRLLAIQKQRRLSREEQIMLAWNRFHLGEVEAARSDFVRLYRARPDRFAADGVYTTYATLGNWRDLKGFADTYKGPIATLYQRHVSERYQAYGLYRKAQAEAPGRVPELEGISSPSAGVEILGRSRSGTAGTSELTEYGARFSGTLYSSALDRFDLSVGIIDLDSGALYGDTPIGKAPEEGEKSYRYSPRTHYSGLFDARIRWEREGLLTPSIALGISPVGGALDPTIVGAIGLRKVDDWGNWQAALYRESVRDSLLSYTGLRDPYTGETWGRVTENGGRFSLYTQLENNWSFYGAASAGIRTGHKVPSNAHVALTAAVNKALTIDMFEFFTIGPSLSLEFFDKNLSGFTFGHGGYFSPSHLIQGMISARFMTHQGRNYLARGSAGFGIQNNRQESAPWFPNQPGTRWITGQSTTGAALLVDLEGLYQLSDQWVVGANLGLNIAPDYNDFSLRVSLRYFFDPRHGLFAPDFATF
ncbi:MAG TPA: cellulose synthase subunit BcsC-related outer membrane protein [Chthoniobacteraceae bacterium]|nr:cellulose synthase subunit BcsC-related outer membrane protein [Chthoniobacteraceae bacterium]